LAITFATLFVIDTLPSRSLFGAHLNLTRSSWRWELHFF